MYLTNDGQQGPWEDPYNEGYYWQIDEEDNNVYVNSLTGTVEKQYPPTILPDCTIMQTLRPYMVEAARLIELDIATITKGSTIVARKFPTGSVFLYTEGGKPLYIMEEAKVGKDFNFITDLTKVSDEALQTKLDRVLKIEHYEYAAEIKAEMDMRIRNSKKKKKTRIQEK